MFTHSLVAGALAAAMAIAAPPAAAQTPKPAPKPAQKSADAVQRTPWGDPDIQGVWTSDEESGVPFERPDQFAGKPMLDGQELDRVLEQREQQRVQAAPTIGGITGAGPTHWYENWGRNSARTSMVVDPADGRNPPISEEGQGRQAQMARARAGRGTADSYDDRSLYDRCITRGVPAVMFPTIYNNNSQIIQTPGYVAITYEMIHETRIIPLDGRPHLRSSVRQLLGDARGHWEGATLVVDSTNFTNRTNYRGTGEALHLIERFTRTGRGAVRYEVTIDDPHTFTRPWTAALNLTATSQLFEYACHEGNYAMSHILSAARSEEKAAASEGRAVRQAATGEER